MRKYIWYMVGTGTKFDGNWPENEAVEMLLPGVGCPGGRPNVRGADVRARRAGCSGSGSGDEQDEHREERLNPGEIRRNLWMEIGGKGWEARSTINKANPQIQTNKISTHQQITKKIGAIFDGDFLN